MKKRIISLLLAAVMMLSTAGFVSVADTIDNQPPSVGDFTDSYWGYVDTLYHSALNYALWGDGGFFYETAALNKLTISGNYQNFPADAYIQSNTVQSLNNLSVQIDTTGISAADASDGVSAFNWVIVALSKTKLTTPPGGTAATRANTILDGGILTSGVGVQLGYYGGQIYVRTFKDGTQISEYNYTGSLKSVNTVEFRNESTTNGDISSTFRVYINSTARSDTFTYDNTSLGYVIGGVHTIAATADDTLSFTLSQVNGVAPNTITASHTHSYVNHSTYRSCSCGAQAAALGQTYKVSFNKNGGSGTLPATITKYSGSSVSIPASALSKTGMVFRGWASTQAKANAGEIEYSYNGTLGGSATYTAEASVTLYAAWAYEVLLNCGSEGWGSTGHAVYKFPNADLSLFHTKASVYNEYGMLPGSSGTTTDQRSFIEWNTAQNSNGKGTGTVYYDKYTANASDTLYCIWGYPIQYNADGGTFPANNSNIWLRYVCGYDGTNNQNPKTLYGNFDFPDGDNTPTKAGCRMPLDSNGKVFVVLRYANGNVCTYERATENLTIPPSGTNNPIGLDWTSFHTTTDAHGNLAVEFHFIWEPSVTYNANGGSGSASDYLSWKGDRLYSYNDYSVKTAASAGISYSGKTFTGWNTKADGSGTGYSAGAVLSQLTSSDPIVLYAQWAGCSHTYGAISYTVAPTCTAGGSGTRTCTICGNVESVTVGPLGHDYQAVVTAPTCTVDGYTTYTCSRCSDSYTGITVAATGHTFTNGWTTVDPTCTEDGSSTATCTVCGTVVTDTIPSPGHNYEEAVTAPTCTAGGYTTYTCSDCGYSYIDNRTDALGHDYQAVVTAPTCTADGYTTYTCSRCSDSYTGNTVAATGHTFTNGWTTVDPTCTEDGSSTATCTVCGTVVTETIPSPGHDYTAVVTAPTCTAGGYTTYTCSDCGNSYVGNQTAKLDHDYSSVVTPATCTVNGYTTFTCSRCGYSYVDNYVVAQHSYISNVVAPTCEDGGYTLYTCTVCNSTYTDTPTAALGHQIEYGYTEGVFDGFESLVIQSAHCTGTSLRYWSYCPRCYENAVEQAGDYFGTAAHTETEVAVTIPATWSTAGEYTYICGECEGTFTKSINPTGATVQFAVANSNGGSGIDVTVNESTYTDQTNFIDSSIILGSHITLTAKARSGYVFKYWSLIGNSTSIVSYSPEYSFDINSSTNLSAVYAKETRSSTEVVFISQNGLILKSSAYTASAKTINYPTNPPSKFGSTFSGWSLTDEQIFAYIADTSVTMIFVTPTYVQSSILYSVNITGGTVEEVSEDNLYEVNSLIAVTADAPAEGSKFSHWIDQNGTIVSYRSYYRFYLSRNVSLSAVYVPVDASVTPTPVISIISVTEGDNKLSFVSERSLPNGCTIIACGIILTNVSDIGTDDNTFAVNRDGSVGANILKGSSKTPNTAGRYTLTKKSPGSGVTWYARGYIMYRTEGSDEIRISYSETVTGVYN